MNDDPCDGAVDDPIPKWVGDRLTQLTRERDVVVRRAEKAEADLRAARDLIRRTQEAAADYLRWHDRERGDDYFDAESRSVRMRLDDVLTLVLRVEK